MEGELIAVIVVAALAVVAIGTLTWALLGWRRADVESREALIAEREASLQAARYEGALQRDRVNVLHRAADRLTGDLDDAHLATAILELLVDAVHAPAGTLHLVRAGDAVVPAVAARGLAPGVLPTVRYGEGLAGRAWRDRRPTAGDHDRQHAIEGPSGPSPAAHETAVPLCHGDHTYAIARIFCAEDRGFADGRLQTAERIAALGALALAHREVRAAALEATRVTSAVLDATPDALALIAADGSVIVENDVMRELRAAGVDPTAGDDPAGGAAVRDELPAASGDGILRRLSVGVCDETGAPLGRVVVLQDITGEHETERLKEEFVALVSHELRTPLTSIIGYLDLVLDDEHLDPDTQRFLDVVQRNARRLLRLVGDLLFVAQVEARQLSLEQTRVDLGQLAADAVEAARPGAEGNGVSLQLSAEPTRALSGDRDRLGQMLDNLIGNAVKFSPEGGRVEVLLADEGGDAVLEVRDTGMGIPPDDLDRLFERFFRSSDAARRAVPGAGLGLTIVKAIVDAHGGTIDVESDPQHGTSFRIVLPYGAGSEDDLDAVADVLDASF